jgi:ubiquinol-cytochrome c reductase cytochrome b subunit
VLVPGVTFLGLYAWPFLEAGLSGDRRPHHLLDRPRDHPVRCAAGVWALSFYGLLLASASNDIIALLLEVPVGALTWIFRGAILVVPVVAAAIAFVLARALRTSGAEGVLHLTFGQVARAARPARRPAPVAGGSGSR